MGNINLKSDFVLGTVNSWSKTCTSCSGYFFSLLFGIDFAGGKVIMDPILSEEPSYEDNKKKVSLNSTSLVSMVPPCNKVSSSTRGLFVAKVTAHAGKTPVFSN
jgi:hypothetical protein